MNRSTEIRCQINIGVDVVVKPLSSIPKVIYYAGALGLGAECSDSTALVHQEGSAQSLTRQIKNQYSNSVHLLYPSHYGIRLHLTRDASLENP